MTGSAYRGVGIADCIGQGGRTAEQVIAYLKTRGPPPANGESPGYLEQEAISWTS